MATELDNARAEAALMQLEESLKRGHISAQQIEMLESAQSSTPFGYDPGQSSPEAVNIVTLYHNHTGEPHPTPEYMVRNFLTRKFPRESWIPQTLWGSAVYSLTPNSKYRKPEILCWFNSNSPKSEELKALGIFSECEKGGGFNNEFEVETHMQASHKRAHQAYVSDLARKEQREMMDLQRAMLEVQRAQLPPTSQAKTKDKE